MLAVTVMHSMAYATVASLKAPLRQTSDVLDLASAKTFVRWCAHAMLLQAIWTLDRTVTMLLCLNACMACT
jgi:hypothetical protein